MGTKKERIVKLAILQQGSNTENIKKEPTEPEKKVTTTVKKSEDPKLKEKKRAASSPRGAGTKTAKLDFNPLAMSDDEFEKAAASIGI